MIVDDVFREAIRYAIIQRNLPTLERLEAEAEAFLKMGFTTEDLIVVVPSKREGKMHVGVLAQFSEA